MGRDGLEKKYPGIRLAKVTVLAVGHGNTPTAYRVRSAFHYGIGELVASVMILAWVAVRAWRRRSGPAERILSRMNNEGR